MDTKKDFYMIRFHNMGELPQYDMKCCFRSEIKKIAKELREKYQFVFVANLFSRFNFLRSGGGPLA